MRQYNRVEVSLHGTSSAVRGSVTPTDIFCVHPPTNSDSPQRYICIGHISVISEGSSVSFHLYFEVNSDNVAYHGERGDIGYDGSTFVQDFVRLNERLLPWLRKVGATIDPGCKAGSQSQVFMGTISGHKSIMEPPTPADLAVLAKRLGVLFGITEPEFYSKPSYSISSYACRDNGREWLPMEHYLSILTRLDPTFITTAD